MTKGHESNCPFCQRSQAPASIVYEDRHYLVRHSAETNIPGYLVIEAKRRFVDLSQATDSEAGSCGQVLRAVMQAIREVMHCQRVYAFSLGEAVEQMPPARRKCRCG
jgi:diadenosine tetraphosphate (Ap4A) HIT family hydrolase